MIDHCAVYVIYWITFALCLQHFCSYRWLPPSTLSRIIPAAYLPSESKVCHHNILNSQKVDCKVMGWGRRGWGRVERNTSQVIKVICDRVCHSTDVSAEKIAWKVENFHENYRVLPLSLTLEQFSMGHPIEKHAVMHAWHGKLLKREHILPDYWQTWR